MLIENYSPYPVEPHLPKNSGRIGGTAPRLMRQRASEPSPVGVVASAQD